MLLTGPGAPQISFHGSLIISANDQTITFVKTSNFTGVDFNPSTGVLAAGTYTVTFRSATNGFVDSLGDPLDGANNGNPAGSNYVATFVVAAPPVVVGIPAFARGPDSADPINLPNSATTGIPLNVSVGSGITSGKFTLQYNSALLSITGVVGQHVLDGCVAVARRGLHGGHGHPGFQQPDGADADGGGSPGRLGGDGAELGGLALQIQGAVALERRDAQRRRHCRRGR